MKITGTGFLSSEGAAEAKQLATRLAPVLALVESAVKLCHQGMTEVKVESQDSLEDKQKVIACVLLARLLEITEAAMTLARGGFSVQEPILNFV